MQKIRALVAAKSSDELVAAPGIRAHLYRMARQLTERTVAQRSGRAALEKADADPIYEAATQLASRADCIARRTSRTPPRA